MNTITTSAIIVTLFLGGPAGPAPIGPPLLWSFFWFFAKLIVFLFVFVWFRATLPRFRYDQLMDLGWKALIPVSLGWLLVVAAIRIAYDRNYSAGQVLLVALVGAAVLATAGLLLGAAMRTSQRRHDLELERT
jgi:NADH-quinone oxidoreductase subunit H